MTATVIQCSALRDFKENELSEFRTAVTTKKRGII